MRCCVLCLLLLLSGPVSATELATGLRPVISSAPEGAALAVAVARADGGPLLFGHRATEPLSMASVTKIFVAAAALEALGPDFTFRTRLVGLGPANDGVLPGLGVIGGGDPCLDGHFTDRQPDRIFEDWAAAILAQGITAIDGDLVIDASLFSGPIRPTTYPPGQGGSNLQRWFSAPASAFAWNDNCIEIRVVPAQPGSPAVVEVRPRSPRITIVNRTTSVASGGSPNLIAYRHQNANTIVVSRSYSGGPTSWFPFAIHADPDLLAGDHLKAILVEQGLPVSGTVRLGPVDTEGGPLLVDHRSPLIPALNILNQRSQNFYGEQILRLIGHHHHQEGSIDAGCRAVMQTLTDMGIDTQGLALLDGSGLSYGNLACAATIIDLLQHMHAHDHSQIFFESLRDRTISASGQNITAKVKTGTLAIANCLAGYIDGTDGTRYAFAFLANRGATANQAWARPIINRLSSALMTATR